MDAASDFYALSVDPPGLIGQQRRYGVADIAELNPRFDVDHRTARVAARLVARLAHGAIG